jgi:drug/metabolite transporter (DMT)-like permease
MRIPTPQLIGLVVLSAIWGASFMAIKVLLDEVSFAAVGWLRLGGGAALILGVVAVQRRSIPRDWDYWQRVLPVGLLGSALPFLLIPWAEREISSQLAGILNGAMPLWAALLAQIVLVEERLDRTAGAGLLLGFAGLAIVIGPGVFDLADASTQGALAMLLAALSYAASAVLVRRRLQGVDSTVLAGNQTLLAFLYLTPIMLVDGPPDFAALSTKAILAALALGVIATGAAYLIYYWLLATIHATQAALVTYLAPVWAVFWGWAILDESLGLGVWPGLALIVLGMYLVNRPARVATERALEAARPAGGGPASG